MSEVKSESINDDSRKPTVTTANSTNSSPQSKEKLDENGNIVHGIGSKHLEKLTQKNCSYGRPAEGSKTLQRGLKAHSHVSNEIRYLCEVIKDSGIPQDDGTFVITFGKLFQIYTVISDKVVGTLLRARKYGFVEFEGEMLYQRRDDYTLIHLKQMPPKDFQLKF